MCPPSPSQHHSRAVGQNAGAEHRKHLGERLTRARHAPPHPGCSLPACLGRWEQPPTAEENDGPREIPWICEEQLKTLTSPLQGAGRGSWQLARSVLPPGPFSCPEASLPACPTHH